MLTGSLAKLIERLEQVAKLIFSAKGWTVCRVKRIQISGITAEYSDRGRYIAGFARVHE